MESVSGLQLEPVQGLIFFLLQIFFWHITHSILFWLDLWRENTQSTIPDFFVGSSYNLFGWHNLPSDKEAFCLAVAFLDEYSITANFTRSCKGTKRTCGQIATHWQLWTAETARLLRIHGPRSYATPLFVCLKWCCDCDEWESVFGDPDPAAIQHSSPSTRAPARANYN